MIWAVPCAYLVVLGLVVLRYRHPEPQLRDYPPRSSGPLVSVIIPARNEAENIAACVRSVLTSEYRALEVIVVDDRSSDETATEVERVRDERVRLVRGAELPAGWFGKPWALVQGWRAAGGALLLFADADTRHTPELVGRVVAVIERERVALVSVLGKQQVVTFWERLIQPHVFVALASRIADLRRINRTRTVWNAIASGQFIMTTREAYERVGTHEAVKDSVAEDAALAQAYVRRDLDIFLLHAVEYTTTRMYQGLAGIVEGWSKNLALGVPIMMPPWPLVRETAPYLMWIPSLAWILPPCFALAGAPWAIATVAVSLLLWAAVYRGEQAPVRYALLYPFGALALAAIMLRSAWRGKRRIEWRGRSYRLTAGR